MRIIFENKKRASKHRFMKHALILIFIFTIIFTVAVFLSTHFGGVDHSTLTNAWFTAVVVEISGLLLKTMLEGRKKKDQEDDTPIITEEEE